MLITIRGCAVPDWWPKTVSLIESLRDDVDGRFHARFLLHSFETWFLRSGLTVEAARCDQLAADVGQELITPRDVALALDSLTDDPDSPPPASGELANVEKPPGVAPALGTMTVTTVPAQSLGNAMVDVNLRAIVGITAKIRISIGSFVIEELLHPGQGLQFYAPEMVRLSRLTPSRN